MSIVIKITNKVVRLKPIIRDAKNKLINKWADDCKEKYGSTEISFNILETEDNKVTECKCTVKDICVAELNVMVEY